MNNLEAVLSNKDTFKVNNREYNSRLFHCFGEIETIVTIPLVLDLLQKSSTQFLTINTHDIEKMRNKDALVIGYTNITMNQISKIIDKSAYTILLNTNLAESEKEAVNRAVLASSIGKSKIIKLEIMNKKHTLPINKKVIKAAEILISRGYEVMPLINPNLEDAKKLQEIGCSLVRVVGSPIGLMRGIEDSKTIKEICLSLTVPVIIDGGIGSPQDVIKGMKLGATGVLVNKAIFASDDPVLTIEQMRSATIIGRNLYLKGESHG